MSEKHEKSKNMLDKLKMITLEELKEEQKEESLRDPSHDEKWEKFQTINKVAKKIMANAHIHIRCLELNSYDRITLTNVQSFSARSLKKLIDAYGLLSLKINDDKSIVLFFQKEHLQNMPKI